MNEHDPLDAFLEEAAPADPPADLAERILAAVSDPERQKQAYWADVGDSARRALIASAAALLVSAGLAWVAVDRTPTPSEDAPVAKQELTDDDLDSIDPLQLAITSEPLERQLAGGYMLLGEER